MDRYNFKTIEKKWQTFWDKNNTFVSKFITETVNVAMAPRKKGKRPSVAIIFIVLGI